MLKANISSAQTKKTAGSWQALSIARAIQGWLFFPLNMLRAHCADARGVFRHSAAAAQWKPFFDSGGAGAAIDALGIAGREAIVQGIPICKAQTTKLLCLGDIIIVTIY